MQSVQLAQEFGSESTLWQVCPLNYPAQSAVHVRQNDYMQMLPNSTQKKNPQINVSHFFLYMLVGKQCSPKEEVLFNLSLEASKSHLPKFSVSHCRDKFLHQNLWKAISHLDCQGCSTLSYLVVTISILHLVLSVLWQGGMFSRSLNHQEMLDPTSNSLNLDRIHS